MFDTLWHPVLLCWARTHALLQNYNTDKSCHCLSLSDSCRRRLTRPIRPVSRAKCKYINILPLNILTLVYIAIDGKLHNKGFLHRVRVRLRRTFVWLLIKLRFNSSVITPGTTNHQCSTIISSLRQPFHKGDVTRRKRLCCILGALYKYCDDGVAVCWCGVLSPYLSPDYGKDLLQFESNSKLNIKLSTSYLCCHCYPGLKSKLVLNALPRPFNMVRDEHYFSHKSARRAH